jgi:hypothetical protein
MARLRTLWPEDVENTSSPMKDQEHNEFPQDTALLSQSEEGGVHVFEIAAPGFRQALLNDGPVLLVFPLIGLAFFIAGLSLTWTHVSIMTLSTVGLSLLMTIETARAGSERWRLRAQADRLEIERGNLGVNAGLVADEQPEVFRCNHVGRLRIPFLSPVLVVRSGDDRVEIGKNLSRREVRYLFERLSQTTGWSRRT